MFHKIYKKKEKHGYLCLFGVPMSSIARGVNPLCLHIDSLLWVELQLFKKLKI
jgi:hypothetical protein